MIDQPASADRSDEKAGSNEKQLSPQSEPGTAREQGRQAEVEVSAAAQDRPSPPTDVQASPVRAMEARNEVRQSVGKAKGRTPSAQAKKQIGKMALAARGDAQAPPTLPVSAAKTAKQRYVREMSTDHLDGHNDAEWRDRSEVEQNYGSVGQLFAEPRYGGPREYPRSRALALMTLRTIEFPDGRRVSRLLPYRWMPYRMIPYPGGDRGPAFGPDE